MATPGLEEEKMSKSPKLKMIRGKLTQEEWNEYKDLNPVKTTREELLEAKRKRMRNHMRRYREKKLMKCRNEDIRLEREGNCYEKNLLTSKTT